MKERIRRVISDVFTLSAATIDNESSSETISKWDSLGHMTLCLALEEEFNVKFTDRQVVEMHDYGSIVRVLSSMNIE